MKRANGVVASLGVTEYMVGATGIRVPHRFVVYRGDRGIVTVRGTVEMRDCYYCTTIAGKGAGTGVERFLTED